MNIEKQDFSFKIGKLYTLIGSYDTAAIKKIQNEFVDFVFLGVVYYEDCLSMKKEPIFSEKGFADLIPGEPFMIIEKKDNWYRIIQTINGYTDIGWIKIISLNSSLKRNIYSINVWGNIT